MTSRISKRWTIHIGLIVSCWLWQAKHLLAQPPNERHFLVVKLGDVAATQELAGEYLQAVAEYFRSRAAFLGERPLKGWIANDPDSAAALLERLNPALAYIPAGFYLKHFYKQRQDCEAIAQTPRFGQSVERYYLVTRTGGQSSLSQLRGSEIRRQPGVDLPYLRKVVFPKDFQPGTDFRLRTSENLADDMFLLLESGSGNSLSPETPQAILLDEELKHFFETDDFVWPNLQIAWRSDDLPRELFVTLGDEWRAIDKARLREVLLATQDDPAGAQMLNLLKSSGFTAVDTVLLEAVARKYFSSN